MGWTFLSNYGVMNYQWSLLKLKNTRLCVHSGIKGNKHNVADLWSDWKTLTCLTKGNKLLVMLKEKKNSAGGESTPHSISTKKESNLLLAENPHEHRLHPIGPHRNMPCKLYFPFTCSSYLLGKEFFSTSSFFLRYTWLSALKAYCLTWTTGAVQSEQYCLF